MQSTIPSQSSATGSLLRNASNQGSTTTAVAQARPAGQPGTLTRSLTKEPITPSLPGGSSRVVRAGDMEPFISALKQFPVPQSPEHAAQMIDAIFTHPTANGGGTGQGPTLPNSAVSRQSAPAAAPGPAMPNAAVGRSSAPAQQSFMRPMGHSMGGGQQSVNRPAGPSFGGGFNTAPAATPAQGQFGGGVGPTQSTGGNLATGQIGAGGPSNQPNPGVNLATLFAPLLGAAGAGAAGIRAAAPQVGGALNNFFNPETGAFGAPARAAMGDEAAFGGAPIFQALARAFGLFGRSGF